MANNPQAYHVTLNDENGTVVKLHLKPGEGMFRELSLREMLKEQSFPESGQQDSVKSNSRTAAVAWTDWSGGSTWYAPRYGQGNMNTFMHSKNMNTVDKPGVVAPQEHLAESVNGFINHYSNVVTTPDDTYVIGTTILEDSTDLDIYKFNTSGAAERVSGVTTGFPQATSTVIKSQVYDSTTKNIYLVQGQDVVYYHPTATQTQDVILQLSDSFFMNLLVHNGRLLFYGGDELREISDPTGTPSIANIYDDGMGFDVLQSMDVDSVNADELIRPMAVRLAVSTSEGIYYVKNVPTNSGLPQPWVFRVERNANGTDIGTPIATLPEGLVVTSIAWHGPSLIMAATTEYQKLLLNNVANGDIPYQFWHLTGGSIGALGMPLGDEGSAPGVQTSLDDTVCALLGSRQNLLFIGSRKGIWVYDSIRGGIHPYLESHDNPADAGVFHSMGYYVDSNNDGRYVFMGATTGGSAITITKNVDRSGTTVESGSGESYELESNIFDFRYPLEKKRLVRFFIDIDGQGDEGEWKLYLSADDSAWNLAYTLEATDASPKSGPQWIDLTALDEDTEALEGVRFQYKLAYNETGEGTARATQVRAIGFEAVTGIMTPAWQFTVDLGQTEIENETLDPITTYTALRNLAKEFTDMEMNVYMGEDNTQLYTNEKVIIESVDLETVDANNWTAKVTVTRAVGQSQ